MTINLKNINAGGKVIMSNAQSGPSWSNVVLLLTGDETTADSSSYTTTVVSGGVTGSTNRAKFGTGSLYFPSNGSYVSYVNSGLFDLLYSATPGAVMSTSFTIEWWQYRQSNTILGGVFSVLAPDEIDFLGAFYGFDVYGGTTTGMTLRNVYYDGDIINTSNLLTFSTTTQTWEAFAITFDGTTLRGYKNGTLVDSTTTKPYMANSAVDSAFFKCDIGKSFTATRPLTTSSVDEMRFTAGYARYTGSSYTVATSAFPIGSYE